METLNYDENFWKQKPCPPVDCRKKSCKCGLKKVFLASVLGDDSPESPIAPKNGAYCNAIVAYEATGNIYIYSQEGIPTLVETDVEDLKKGLAREILDRRAADGVLQDEIDAIKNSPDVVDIVATYAALQVYDTQHLGDNDVIRVLADETHDGQSTYYRWDKQTETWTYIGSVQTAANTIFYADLSETGNTRHIYKNSDMTGTVSVQELLDANEDGQVILRMSSAQTPENFNDAYLQNTYVGVDDYQFLFLDNRNYYEYDGTATTDTSYYYSRSTIQLALTAGNNITITGNTISATDTTYSNFTGTDGISAGAAGLVPAPATTDVDKYLKSDGTWAEVAGGAGGEAKELTSADYNWNWSAQNATTTPFDTVALWLLEPGMYYNKSGVKVATSKTSADTNESSYLVGAHAFYTDIVRNYPGGDVNGSIVWYKTRTDNGNASNIGTSTCQNFLTSANLKNVTGTSFTDVMSQNAVTSMIFADPSTAGKIKILGAGLPESQFGSASISIGLDAKATKPNAIAIGRDAYTSHNFSVAIGYGASTSANGEFNIGTGYSTVGYNSSTYRLLSGLYDGQTAHDAATVGQALGETESYTIATSDWSALSASSPYTYQATVTATHTIGASTIAELINDTPVTFATYGFAIGSISGQSVIIYSIGQPSASVTLKVNYKG